MRRAACTATSRASGPAVGRLLHRSTTMAFCDGAVYGEDGKLCAHATGTFKYLKALPGKGRSLKALQRSED